MRRLLYRRFIRLAFFLAISLFFGATLVGCASYNKALTSTLDYLNARKAKGCLRGHIIAGGGFGGGVTGDITFAAATGGADPKVCQGTR